MNNEATVSVNLIEALADKLASWLRGRLALEELDFLKVKLGLEVMLINITKGIIVYGLALILNIFFLTLILHGSYLLIRRKSAGLHAESSLICTLTSVLLFVLIPLMVKEIILGPFIVLILFVISFSCLSMFAPADTEKRPLIGEENRQQLRNQALKYCVILGSIALLCSMNVVGTMITVGVIIQVICILPITYKLLKRGYRNYEKYEKELNE